MPEVRHVRVNDGVQLRGQKPGMMKKPKRPNMRGSVDFLEPEFLHALGIAVATFARLEGMLVSAYFAAEHRSADFAAFPESALAIHDAPFATKIEMVFTAIKARTTDFEERGFDMLRSDFHAARDARNFLIHGVWLKGANNQSYRCSMIDRRGRKVGHEVGTETVIAEATRAEHLMIELKSLLVNEGLYPPVGPRL